LRQGLTRIIRRPAVHHAKAEPLYPPGGKTGGHGPLAQGINRVGDHEELAVESASRGLLRVGAHQFHVFLQLDHANVHVCLRRIRNAAGSAEDKDVTVKDIGRRDLCHRREYIRAGEDDLFREKGVKKRKTVSNMEIWCECFGNDKKDLKPSDSYLITSIMARMKGWSRAEDRLTIPLYGRQRVYLRDPFSCPIPCAEGCPSSEG